MANTTTDSTHEPARLRWKRRLRRSLLVIFLLPPVLIALVAVLIYLPPVQDKLRGALVSFLQEKIGTPVRLDAISLRYPLGITLEGLLLMDQTGDTLLSVGQLSTHAGLRALLDGRIELGGTRLSEVVAEVHQRPDSTFNFTHILRAFAKDKVSAAPDEAADSSASMPFSMSDVALESIRVHLVLEPVGLSMRAQVGSLDAALEAMDAAAMRFHVTTLNVSETHVDLRTSKHEPEPDSYPDLVNPFAGLDLRLTSLGIRNVSFTLMNTVAEDSLWLRVGTGDLVVDSMAMDRQRIRVGSLALDDVDFGTLRIPVDVEPANNGASPPLWLDERDGFRYWARGLDIGVRQVSLTNGGLGIHRTTVRTPRVLFDGEHMAFGAIALHADDILFNDQRISAAVKEFSAKGADSTALRARFRLEATPSTLNMIDGMLAVNRSELRFQVMAEPGEPARAYLHPQQIPLSARVNGSIDLGELPDVLARLGIALPKPLATDEVWETSLSFKGTMQRADTIRADVLGDKGTVLHMFAEAEDMRRLPETPFHLELSRLTMGSGLRALLATYQPRNLPVPAHLTAVGRFTGNGRDLDAVIDVRSDLGDVAGTVLISPKGTRMPDAFAADLVVDHFELGRLTADSALGPVNARLHARGSDLNTSARKGNATFTITGMEYHGQELAGASAVASLSGDSLHLRVTTTAPSLGIDLHADARWPLGGDTISGAVDLRADRVDMHGWGWYPHPLGIEGRWRGEGTFTTHGSGSFELEGDSIVLSNPERSFRFNEFVLGGHLSNDSARLELQSDALELAYNSNFPLDSILPRAREKMSAYFRADSTSTSATGERMDLKIGLPRTEWLTGILLPQLRAIGLNEFTAHYDGDADELHSVIDLSILEYGDISISNLGVNVDADRGRLDGTLRLDSARYNTIHLGELTLTAASAPGTLRTELRVRGADGSERYVIPVEFTRDQGILGFHLNEGLFLDSAAWAVDPLNGFRFTDPEPVAEHFVLSNGAQLVGLVTAPGRTTVRLEQFPIGSILNIVSLGDTAAMFAGTLDGEVVLPAQTNGPLSADLRVEDVALKGEPLGDLMLRAEGKGDARYVASARFEGAGNSLDATVHYDAAQAGPTIEAHAALDFTDLSIAQPFVNGILYGTGGGMNGSVDWSSRGKVNSLRGDITFTEAVFGVEKTGAYYRLRNERLVVDDRGLTFQDFTIMDSVGSAFVLDGLVLTSDLTNMRFDLSVRTDSFQLVNSAPAKDALFFGDLMAGMDIRITGTDKAPVVKGELEILAGTSFSVVLPGGEVKLVDHDGIVEFTSDLDGEDSTRSSTGEERLRDSLRAHLPRVDLDLRVRVAKRASFAVVLDPVTGDQATFQGAGDLRFTYDTEGRMRLLGEFVVSEGGYTLEFYGLVKKRFDLIEGSKVTWDGDPIGAEMDISARYISESAAFPLVANGTGPLSETERNRLSSRLPFEVVINIDGGMKKPDIGFALDLPREFRNSYPQVNDELDRLSDKSREEERNRQVFGLLVLNSFIQDEGAGGAPSSGLVSGAARSSVNGILTDQMNKLTGKYVKGIDIELGVSTVDQAQGNATYQRTSVDYKVSKRFLDERLSFEVGGSVGVDENEANTSNVGNTRAAQYAIFYDLTRDGRLRLRGFYQNAFDLYDGEITDSGIALMHTKDFEENEIAREARRERLRQERAQELRRRKDLQKRDQAPNAEPTPP